jgi:hypothetical protein
MPETPLEMAKRHVREGADRIERQRILAEQIRARGDVTLAAQAETLLAEFLAIQAESIAHMKRLMRRP